jgi:hypothetical protein
MSKLTTGVYVYCILHIPSHLSRCTSLRVSGFHPFGKAGIKRQALEIFNPGLESLPITGIPNNHINSSDARVE